jgi:ankyrin repeat protein
MRKTDRKYVATHFVNIILSTCTSVSPVLVAAKRGVREMVKSILEKIPVAILDQDTDEKNIILLAVEHRQVDVYKLMLDLIRKTNEMAFVKLDKKGNSVLHLAAMLRHNHPRSDSAVIQMLWECKWFKVTYIFIYMCACVWMCIY